MSGFQVNTQELADTGTEVDGKAQEARELQSKVGETAGMVPSRAWGLLGNLGPYQAYSALLGQVNQHMANMAQGLQKLADDIKTTAEQYTDIEQETASSFTDIDDTLGGE